MSPDPLSVHAAAADLNVYAYVGGRVASHVDPWGLCSAEAGGENCIGGAYFADAAGNQGSAFGTVGDGGAGYTPGGEHHGLVGEMFREWVASGRPSYAGLDWGPAASELSLGNRAFAGSMGIDLPPLPNIGTQGHAATSAGGPPSASLQEIPSSRSDYLARKHPALARGIRGAQRQDTFVELVPLVVAVLTSGVSAAPEVAAGASTGGQPFAMGLTSQGLEEFAASRGATTWKQLPDTMNWKGGVLDKLADPNTQVHFNLDGVNAWQGVSRAAAGRGGPTDWELLTIQQNPQFWGSIQFWEGGAPAANPFQ